MPQCKTQRPAITRDGTRMVECHLHPPAELAIAR
jgi:hypothetical protein